AGVVGRPCVVKDAASGVFGDVARLRRVWQGGWVLRQLRLADAGISLNSEMTTELRDVGIPQERIRLIPNGVDCGHFISPSAHQRARAREELGIASTDVVTLCAGRLSEDTGTKYMIDAWQLVEREFPAAPWSLILAGDQAGSQTFRALGDRFLRRARFVGKVKDIRPFLAAADVLVRPSLTEGMSNVVLEAMATGLPVVASDTGGLKEQVD